jgi:formylglycine-generating enzyme required for sulfatase activity
LRQRPDPEARSQFIWRSGLLGTDPKHFDSESPHRRRIPRSFAIGSRSVTVAEFQRFLKDRPHVRHNYTKRYSPELQGPTISVTWFEAAQHCNWLSEKEGIPESEWCYPKHEEIKEGMKPYPDYLKRKGYRLPTEAEWEYACRAGTVSTRSYGGSVELLPRYAWFQANARDRTWPVGQKRPNDLGLFDVHGNVWNWCQAAAFHYPPMVPGRPTVDQEDIRHIEDRIGRVFRGGSFNDQAMNVRSPNRGTSRPIVRNASFGLRVARTCD